MIALYYKGRFSNGPTWAETAASSVLDLAVGGATTGNDLIHGFTGPYANISVPGVSEQVDAYLASRPAGLGCHVHVWFAGANDAYFGQVAGQVITGTDSAKHLLRSVGRVQQEGGERNLLFLLPELARIPFLNTPDTAALRPVFEAFTTSFNAELERAAASDGSLRLFPTQRVIERAVAQRNISDTTSPCLTAGVVCANPTSHMYFDEFHYTAVVHRAIGEAVARFLCIARATDAI